MEAILWGVLLVLGYIVISNTIYLLVGARVLQFLPGVNIRGFRGTVRLAFMLACAAIALATWLISWAISLCIRTRPPSKLTKYISAWVGRGARLSRTLDSRQRRSSVSV